MADHSHYPYSVGHFNTYGLGTSSNPARAAILGWVLDGYSDGQIARHTRRSPDEISAVRSALRSEGWA